MIYLFLQDAIYKKEAATALVERQERKKKSSSKKKKPQNTISLKDFCNLVDLEQQGRQSSVNEGERMEMGGSGTRNSLIAL